MPESVPPPARWSLSEDPSIGWLKRRAKQLRDAYADPAGNSHDEAVELVKTYDPPADGPLSLTRAQRVLARAFGFSGWSRLREHLAVIEHWSVTPEAESPGPEPEVDRLLRLLTLGYGSYDVASLDRGAELLRSDPGLATASVPAMAACGRVDELARALADRPAAASAVTGPHRWPPLLYLCYSRIGVVAPELAGDPVAAARVLLDHGADPDAGFLWRGLTSPFTAVTGALGGGERDEPHHPQGVALTELLLEAGADPNDNQALYNRMFRPDDSHLPPLMRHGLGRPHASVWRDRLGDAYPSPEQMVGDHLCFAAEHGYVERVRLLLDHGVDPLSRGDHPVLADRTAYEIAVRAGQTACAEVIAAAGGDPGTVSDVDLLLGAALAADAAGVDVLLLGRPELAAVAVQDRPDALAVAGERQGIAAVEQLLRIGFDIDASGDDDRTALHEAAFRGDVALCRWLVEHGADRSLQDCHHHGTPAGWAAYAGHAALATELDPDPADETAALPQ